jgi:hypothetical protein
MNYEKAIESLQLKKPFTKKDIKKAYYSMAIKYHPDKSKSNSEKFVTIKSAYDFLNNYSSIHIEEDDSDDDASDYISLLKKCIKLVSPETNWTNLFMDSTFKNIIIDCENLSLKIFKGLDKEKSIEIYNFLSTYHEMFHIQEKTLEEMRTILQEKRKNDNLIILEPTLDDLFDEKIYILEICDKKYYIPLWCHELCYDISGDDLIVKCHPKTNKDIYIDDNNNIFININKKLAEVLGKPIIFHLGKKILTIDSSELFIKSKQTFTFYNEGIPRFNQSDIYRVKNGHIYVNINLS